MCSPLANNKPFNQGDELNPYNCEPCECHNHADSCEYNMTQGGGMCLDCQHNTEGRMCDTCKGQFFRPSEKSLDDLDVCQPCDCFDAGVADGNYNCNKVMVCY